MISWPKDRAWLSYIAQVSVILPLNLGSFFLLTHRVHSGLLYPVHFLVFLMTLLQGWRTILSGVKWPFSNKRISKNIQIIWKYTKWNLYHSLIIKDLEKISHNWDYPSRPTVPNVFGTRDQFYGRQNGDLTGWFSGWFKHVDCVHFISVIASTPPQIIWHQILI